MSYLDLIDLMHPCSFNKVLIKKNLTDPKCLNGALKLYSCFDLIDLLFSFVLHNFFFFFENPKTYSFVVKFCPNSALL